MVLKYVYVRYGRQGTLWADSQSGRDVQQADKIRLFGIIFYLREVLLTLHYEKRLFEHASQPRVAGSEIRLLSHLWSRTNLSRDSYQSG